MNCRNCRSLFSDYVERALTPVLHEAVAKHLTDCPSCKSELRDFGRALQVLRAGKREEPPDGFLEAVVAAAGDALPAAVADRAGSAAAGARERRPWLPWLLAAAAALLLVSVSALLVAREKWWTGAIAAREEEVRSGLGGRLEGLEAERERLLAERDRLAVEQKASAGREAEARRSLEQAAAEARTSRQEFEERLLRVEAESRRGLEEVAALRKELARARDEAADLARELALARERNEERAGADAEARFVADAARRTRGVVFTTNNGRLELDVRGPKEEVVAELFAVAADGANPETANLALNALENILGAQAGAEPEAAGPEARGWFGRRLDGLATVMGMEASVPDEGATVLPDRAERLRVLEKFWLETKNKAKE